MTKRTVAGFACAALALAVGIIQSPAVPAGAADVAAGALAPVLKNYMGGIERLKPVHATNPAQVLNLGIGLQRPDPAGEDRYFAAEYDPSSPSFHHFLTPAQFNNRFGVPATRLNALLGWLRGGGLRVQTVPGATDYVLASGSAAQVVRLFHVQLNDYSLQGRSFYANTGNPFAPANLGVASVAGLNNLEGPRLNPKAVGRKPAVVKPAADSPPIGLTSPYDLWSIYGQPGDNFGEGQQVAVFGWGVTGGQAPGLSPTDGGIIIRDLRQFEIEYHLPATPLTLNYYGTETKVTDNGGLGEWHLDTQAQLGMAPDVTRETLYFGKAGSDPDLIGAYTGWVNDPTGPLQGSSSFSGCEQAPGTDNLGGGPGSPGGVILIANAMQDQYDAELKQATLEGRTMFASAGDTASSCPFVSVVLNGVTPAQTPLAPYPAASPYAVGVGGTVLYWGGSADRAGTGASRTIEYGWPYSGGGPSCCLKAPAYQLTLPAPGLLTTCATDNHGTPYLPPVPCRGVPDVAAQSGDVTGNGYTITDNGSNDSAGGGTSLSAPLWAGMWARVQANSHTGTGFANPSIYAIGADSTKYANDFFDVGDVTNGQTITTCNGAAAPINCTKPGWDYVTGFGVPKLASLMKDVNQTQGTAPVNPVRPPAVPTVVPALLNPCTPLWTNAVGNDDFLAAGFGLDPLGLGKGMNPQLNVIEGHLALSPDGKNLVTTIKVDDLNKSLPAGGNGNVYYARWTWHNVQYESEVFVDASGNVTYRDGTLGSTGHTTRTGANDTGEFNDGTGGTQKLNTVVVNVPLTAMSPVPKVADVLSSPIGETREETGTSQTGGAVTLVDSGGPGYDYQVGAVCAASTIMAQPNAAAGSGMPNTSAPTPVGTGLLVALATLLCGCGLLALRSSRAHL